MLKNTIVRTVACGILSVLVMVSSSFAESITSAARPADSRYLVVLKPKGEKPDFEKAGASIEYSAGLYHVINLPSQAIAGIRNNPNVHYVQRYVSPEEALAIHHSAPTPLRSASSASITPQVAPAPAAWTSGAYQYDGSGNIKAIGSHTYKYDALGRLLQASYGLPGAAHNVTESYSYDGFGNLLSKTGTPRSVGSITVDSTTNRLKASSGAVYDGAGNLGEFGTHSRFYDPARMIRRIDTGLQATHYLYDANDERIASIDHSGAATWTIRGLDGEVLRRFTTTNTQFYVWSWQEDNIYREGKLLAAQRVPEKGGRIHFHLDHLGTPRQITSEEGEELSRHDYDPFGTEVTPLTQLPIRGLEANSFQFTGHERDYHSGTYEQNVDYDDYMHARYYSPVFGRFLSVDPGKDWDPRRPQSWNLYSYTRNNPVNFTDPTGRYLGASNEQLAAAHDAMTPEQREQFAKAQETGFKIGGVALALMAGPSGWRVLAPAAMNWIRGNPGAIQQGTQVIANLAGPPGSSPVPDIPVSVGNLKHISRHLGKFQKFDSKMTLDGVVKLGKSIAGNADNLIGTPGRRKVYEAVVKVGDQELRVRAVLNPEGGLRSVNIRY